LVIDPKARYKCSKVVRRLKEINNKCTKEGESYFFAGDPKPMSEELSPVENYPYFVEVAERRMASSDRSSARQRPFEQRRAEINSTLADQPARQVRSRSTMRTQRHRASEVDDQTPLLSSENGEGHHPTEYRPTGSHDQVMPNSSPGAPNRNQSCWRRATELFRDLSGRLHHWLGCWNTRARAQG
jgi:hypothetical protein